MLTAMSVNMRPGKWYVDSGCSKHMTPDRDKMVNFSSAGADHVITAANNESMSAREVELYQ